MARSMYRYGDFAKYGIPLAVTLAVVLVINSWWTFPAPDFQLFKSSSSSNLEAWMEFASNPVLPNEIYSEQTGTVFDLGLLLENMTMTGVPADLYYLDPNAEYVETAMAWRMWNSWRPRASIGYSTSLDGINWDQDLEAVLSPNILSGWETEVNRPYVKKLATGMYVMWYTGQGTDMGQGQGGKIGYAESEDGIKWVRRIMDPVLEPSIPWESEAVMTPSIVDLPNGVLRMYYAGGQAYEPDAIGVAHSYDGGLTWVKHGNPVFEPDRTSGKVGTWWDSAKVTSPHVIVGDDGYYYLFYAGFRNVDYSSIGIARSKDGLTDWERHVGNPIVDIRSGGWNCDAVYKPFVGWSEQFQRWLLWYNGRCGDVERIGVSSFGGKSFGNFVKRG